MILTEEETLARSSIGSYTGERVDGRTATK
jgi:hypothetical protein